MRFLVQFRKVGTAVYISHLDLMRTMQRALRRANIPMCYSQGFNPHPILSFAMASPVGMTSHAEYMDIKVEDGADPMQMTHNLIAALPDGISVVRTCTVEDTYPALMSRVSLCDCAITFPDKKNIESIWQEFMAQEEILVQKHSKKGLRTVDIKPMILQHKVTDNSISLRLCAGSAANLSPTLLAQAFCDFAKYEPDFRCLQRGLFAGDKEEPKDLFELV